MMSPTSADIRSLIREVISEVLPQLGVPIQPHPVIITNDQQLNDFVERVTTMLDDPITGPMLRAGRLRFRLDETTTPPATPSHIPDNSTNVITIEKGVLTERTVARAITEGAELALGRTVVITPLARERLRKSAITVVRQP